jgi:transmembrane sensor
MNENPNPAGGHAPDEAQRQIDLAAAEWMIRRDRGFTAAEQDEFFAWLAADPRHGERFAQHQATWQDLNLLAQWRPEHATEPNPDLLAKPPARKTRRLLRPLVFFPVLLAAAAAVALLLTWERPGSRPDAPRPDRPATPAIAFERRVLEDGSTVDLARGAAIEVRFTADERHVRLMRGEAFFTVAKNPARPFVVNAGGVNVRAVGTAFNVRLDARSVEVEVAEGRVRVVGPKPEVSGQPAPAVPAPSAVLRAPPTETFLSAGERAVVPRPPAVMTVPVRPIVAQTAVPRAPARLLEFQAVPLADVVAEFNRHNPVQLKIGDAELEDLPIVASFRADNVEGFVRLLQATAGVTAERADDTITLRKAP